MNAWLDSKAAYDDELFGPVASLIKAKDNDDAMRIANDSRYGLGGGIFSKDEKKAIELAKKSCFTIANLKSSTGTGYSNMSSFSIGASSRVSNVLALSTISNGIFSKEPTKPVADDLPILNFSCCYF